jgi:hypothetical protein
MVTITAKEIPSISKESNTSLKRVLLLVKRFSVVNLQRIASIQIGKNNESKMLRNTPISPVIKADAESDARFFFPSAIFIL